MAGRSSRRRIPFPARALLAAAALALASEGAYRLSWLRHARRQPETGTFELYAIGGSTAAGAPFGTGFVHLAAGMLGDEIAGRRIVVHNLAQGGASIYPQTLALERRLRYRDRRNPAAVLIYCAENEEFDTPQRWLAFHRALRWLKERALYRSFLLSDLLCAAERGPLGPRDLRRRGIRDMRHYEFYMRRALTVSRQSEAVPILATVAGNLRVEPRHTRGAEAVVAEGLALEKRGQYRRAAQYYLRRAAEGDDLAALLHYRRGRCQEALGDDAAAKDAYWEAIARERNRQRATREQNELLRRLAAELDVPLFDAAAAFEGRSPRGIPGRELFVDIMHPSLEGHLLLARGFADALARLHHASVRVPEPAELLPGHDRLVEALVISGISLVTQSDGFVYAEDRLALAESHLRRALVLEPDNFSGWLGLAIIDAVRRGKLAQRSGRGWLDQHGISGGVFRFCAPEGQTSQILRDLAAFGVSRTLLGKAERYKAQAYDPNCGHGPAFITQPSRFSGLKAG